MRSARPLARTSGTVWAVVALVAAVGLAVGAVAWRQAAPGARTSSPRLQPAAEVVAGQPAGLRVEPMGDSITWGYQSTTGNGYRGPLWNELTAEGYQPDFVGSVQSGTMSDPDNEGHPGWRIDQLAAITDQSLATYKPQVVTLMIGTNDLGQNYQVATAPARLKALVAQIVRDDPAATVLVANLIVSTNTVVAPAEPAFNAAIPGIVAAERAAGRHVALVNMHAALTTADMFDALHPNDTGYQLMASTWNQAIQAAAKAGWIPSPAGPVTPGTTGPVVSGIAGKCLDVKGGSAASGTPVELYHCDQTAAQSWTLTSSGALQARGKCLGVIGAATTDGALTDLQACAGATGGQVWKVVHRTLVNSASGKCLDDPASSSTDGTQLDIWDCNGGSNQEWTSGASAAATAKVPCRASMSNAKPKDNSTVTVRVATNPQAAVATVAHYKTTQAKHQGWANTKGEAGIAYHIGGAAPGYQVKVSVSVASGRNWGSCATSFTPQR